MTPPADDVAFAQVREDPAVEARALDRANPGARGAAGARALLVCSGGDTALALLGRDDVERVDVVDPNPAQLHLCELKRAAADALPRDDLLRLLGVLEAGRDERLALYARVRDAVTPDARAHWDARPGEVAAGVQQRGRFEALFRELAAAFRAAGLDPLARPGEALAWPGWRGAFERVFERERLAATFGRAAVAYSMERSFGEHFADVFASALRRAIPEGSDPPWEGENPFLRQVWEDRYAPDLGGPQALPDWLREPGRIASRNSRLHMHLGTFQDALPHLAREGPYDLVQTSNISDWMPVPALEAMVDEAASALAPGGALVMRRLNGDHDLQAIVARRLDVDPDECARLLREDRSFFYREVVIGRRPFEWGCP